MSRITSDPNDPGVQRGPADTKAVDQSDVYLVLSNEERAKGFVRPVRTSYVHVGISGPRFPLRDLSPEEVKGHERHGYIKKEEYPKSELPVVSRLWTQEMLDGIDNGCQTVTTMGRELAETYARNPQFYGATYCVGCNMHRPVGGDGEFVWDQTEERVGT